MMTIVIIKGNEVCATFFLNVFGFEVGLQPKMHNKY